jgi:hypothetical protein
MIWLWQSMRFGARQLAFPASHAPGFVNQHPKWFIVSVIFGGSDGWTRQTGAAQSAHSL